MLHQLDAHGSQGARGGGMEVRGGRSCSGGGVLTDGDGGRARARAGSLWALGRWGKGSSKSLVIVRIKSVVSCRGRGRDLGKNVSAGVMTGGSHLSASAGGRAGRWAAGGLLGYARVADSYGPRPTRLKIQLFLFKTFSVFKYWFQIWFLNLFKTFQKNS